MNNEGTMRVDTAGTEPVEPTLSEEDWNRFNSEYENGLEDARMDEAAAAYLEQLTEQSESGIDFSAEKIENPALSMSLDSKNHLLRYELPNGSSFSSSVPQGMLTNQGVYVHPMENAMVFAYRDQEAVTIPADQYYSMPGSYQISMTCYNTAGSSTDFNLYQVNFYFRILEKTVGDISVVTAPENFKIHEVTRNNQVMPLSSEQGYLLKKDGDYRVVFTDCLTGTVGMEVNFKRDSVAPQITFSKEIRGGTVEGPVTFYTNEENCSFLLLRDGVENTVVSHNISTTGYYSLTAVDEAGNAATERFGVIQHYQFWDWKILVILFMLFLGMGAKLLSLRNDMKVT